MATISPFTTGVFTLSLDFELIWGTIDRRGIDGFRHSCEVERAEVIDRLLELLAEFEVPATWAIVGHLCLAGCSPVGGCKHPEIVRPKHSWVTGDWFDHDPGGNEGTAPLFFGRSLIQKIRGCSVTQEIGSHSFSHVIFGDPGCSRSTAESELRESVRAARDLGIELRSFVFPRNSVGHLDIFPDYGFTCFRAEPASIKRPATSQLARLIRLIETLTASRPAVGLPELTASGMWNIPASMIYVPMHGMRRFLPMSLRVRRAVRGLERAAEESKIFHLWFHPTNLADGIEYMFRGLRQILQHAANLRAEGRLVFRSMGQIADECQQRRLSHSHT
jgi:peptidoglycan/xylan/chitin deacetylase (PgdA/CDA1 family)